MELRYASSSPRAVATGGTKELDSSTPWNATATANVSTPIWSPVAAGPVGELRERAAELAFQISDLGAITDALEPLQHHRHILAVFPDLFHLRLPERKRPG